MKKLRRVAHNRVNVDIEKIKYYYSMKKTITEISILLNIGRNVVFNRLKELKLPRNQYRPAFGKNNPGWTGYGRLSGKHMQIIRGGAKYRNISCSITTKEAWEQFEKQGGVCALTGISLEINGDTCGYNSVNDTASLDRINSKIGYEINNIWWLFRKVNMIKWKVDLDEFIKICKEVRNYEKG